MPLPISENIINASKAYPKPNNFKPDYGTAGFRSLAENLPSTVFRCGIIMAARAFKTNKSTGICITASHNPAPDNGVKLVEPSGEMLCQEWEPYANKLANAETDEELAKCVAELLNSENITIPTNPASLKMLIAHDTRSSGPSLSDAAAAGAKALGLTTELHGLRTTPQLHWSVMQLNKNLPSSEQDYYTTLATAFKQLVGTNSDNNKVTLHIDCANGVGAPKMAQLAPLLSETGLEFDLRNTGKGVLNGGCGSDFIQRDKQLPENFTRLPPTARCAAVDGDSDRLMYFRPLPISSDTDGDDSVIVPTTSAQLFDGDRIAALVAAYCSDLLTALGCGPGCAGEGVSLGIIQTAYANGASTNYLQNQPGCSVKLTPTGVKYLHEAAHHFDIGIYFEANGHGMVLFKPAFLEKMNLVAVDQGNKEAAAAASDFIALSQAVNQSVGDAISGILLVEAALRKKGWGLEDWAALYTDLPSRQLKVKVADRKVITTTDAETKVSEPKSLQPLIDVAVAEVPNGRAFVRPSGTEDVVRVYAEAVDQKMADILANTIAALVYKHAGGVGDL
jgi:phosphoacetylglucosamine mutase